MAIVDVSYPENGINDMWDVRMLLENIVRAVKSHPEGIYKSVNDRAVMPNVKLLNTQIERIDYNLNLIMNHINNPSISGSLKLMNKDTFKKILETKDRAEKGTIIRERNLKKEMQNENAAFQVLKDKERNAEAKAEAEAEEIRKTQLKENPWMVPTPEQEPEPESKNSQGWSLFRSGGTKRISSKRKTTRRRRRR
jgi:hypothetical protein